MEIDALNLVSVGILPHWEGSKRRDLSQAPEKAAVRR